MTELRVVDPAPNLRRPRPSLRRSRNARRRALVLLAVHLLIGAHIVHWLVAGRTVTPVEPSEAMAFSRAGVINAGLLFFAAAIVATAIFGRFFCGWGCHLLALQDLARWLLARVGIRPQPLRSRALRAVPSLAFAYMFLWPLAHRLGAGEGLRWGGAELTTEHFWATFPGWAIGGLTLLVCGFGIVYFLGAKGFCAYACPYGAIFGVADRVAPLRIRVTDACEGCGHCTAVCTSNVRVHEEVRDWGMVVSSDCMKCQDCVSVCPKDALYYGKGPIPWLARPLVERPAKTKPRLAGWEEVVLAVSFAGAFFAFRGLYGAVPFLLALGLAGILSFLTLVAVRLAVRRDVTVRRIRLRWKGRLQRAGWAFVASAVLLAAFWVHSASVRASAFLGQHTTRTLSTPLLAALDVASPAPALTEGELERLERGRAHLRRALGWGLFATPGIAAELATLDLLSGDAAAFSESAARARELGEETPALLRALGREAWARGDLAAATAAYRRASTRWPAWDRPYNDLGIVAARSGDLEQAAAVLEEGRERAPSSADLAYNLGVVRALQGDAQAATDLFAETLRLDPSHLQARENLEAARSMGVLPRTPSAPVLPLP
ncbi:MAG TPA: 4Fe-4S binding protein [Thermoanaerobaculia bacterium]|nr:4Fe-4S binding protein [Thermoanaerobaculia bacterium]